MTRHPNVVLVSGLSGAGKNTALRAFEDAGFRVIDALPATVITESVREIIGEGPVAIVVDVRCGDVVAAETAIVAAAAEVNAPLRRVFIEASDETLLRRYAESRRPHPIAAGHGTIEAAIVAERGVIAGLRTAADAIIATDELEPRRLAETLLAVADGRPTAVRPALHLVSFGFKHGLPPEAEWLLDVRSLPNPYYDPALRARTGADPDVARAAMENPRGALLLTALIATVGAAIEAATADGRRAVTVAVGCTGGVHRSVAVAEAIAAVPAIRAASEAVRIHHRDIARH
jgi:UPF0042 nucleotide-binding protein